MAVLDVVQSISGLTWEMQDVDDREVLTLTQRFGMPEVMARILSSRGITADTAEDFLNPTLKKNLPNPLILKDMEKAANRIADSVIRAEPIGLMGDYDVDGATSTALLRLFLEDLGIQVYTLFRKGKRAMVLMP